MPRGVYQRKPKPTPDPMAGYTGAKETKPKGPRLAAETRTYRVEEAELAAWLTADTPTKFFIQEVWIQPNRAVEFVLSTTRPTEVPVARRVQLDDTIVTGPTTGSEADLDTLERETGPTVTDDDEAVGSADTEPQIAPTRPNLRKFVRTHRDAVREARKKGLPEPAGPRITHRNEDEDDPVPSSLPE